MLTMDPKAFLRTIYLGDRACKSILIDGWRDRVLLQVTLLSRIRSPSGEWEFYSAEDIVDGAIVFTGVDSIRFDPPGPLPNDYIHGIEVEERSGSAQRSHVFRIHVSSGERQANPPHYREVFIEIVAEGIHLEDPSRPGVAIVE